MQNRASFDDLIMGATRGAGSHIEAFWKAVLTRGDTRIDGHPMRCRSGWMQCMVPLAVHGDGVPVTRISKKGSKSYDAHIWQRIVARGTTFKVNFEIFEDNKTTSAMDTIWDMIVWSLYFLYLGIWPTVDVHGAAFPAGSPEAMLAGSTLAGGVCGVVRILKGGFLTILPRIFTLAATGRTCVANGGQSTREI